MAQDDLAERFRLEMEQACEQAAELGYYPSYFLREMRLAGAVPYAKRLVRSGELQSGLIRLKKLDRLNLSVEHLVARVPDYASLFTREEREAAEWRLKQVAAA